jgi:hypothetical protein
MGFYDYQYGSSSIAGDIPVSTLPWNAQAMNSRELSQVGRGRVVFEVQDEKAICSIDGTSYGAMTDRALMMSWERVGPSNIIMIISTNSILMLSSMAWKLPTG